MHCAIVASTNSRRLLEHGFAKDYSLILYYYLLDLTDWLVCIIFEYFYVTIGVFRVRSERVGNVAKWSKRLAPMSVAHSSAVQRRYPLGILTPYLHLLYTTLWSTYWFYTNNILSAEFYCINYSLMISFL